MSAGRLRILEMFSLLTIALASLGIGAYMIHLGRMGEAFGSLIGIVPLCINAIRQLGQTQVMNSLADHLAASRPDAQDDKGE